MYTTHILITNHCDSRTVRTKDFYEVLRNIFKSLPELEVLTKFEDNPSLYKKWMDSFEGFMEPELYTSPDRMSFVIETPTSRRIIQVRDTQYGYPSYVEIIFTGRGSHYAAGECLRELNLLIMKCQEDYPNTFHQVSIQGISERDGSIIHVNYMDELFVEEDEYGQPVWYHTSERS